MSLPEFDVAGQKALIVGAGRGIGKGIALAFAEAGADVAITSLSEATVGKVAEEVRSMSRGRRSQHQTPLGALKKQFLFPNRSSRRRPQP